MRYLRRGRAATLPATKTPDRLGESGIGFILAKAWAADYLPCWQKAREGEGENSFFMVIENVNNLIGAEELGNPSAFLLCLKVNLYTICWVL